MRKSRGIAALGALLLVMTAQGAHAAGGQVQASMSASASTQCHGVVNVQVQIDGQSPPPGLVPVDVMLTLDKSGSMATGNAIASLRTAANSFVDIMDQSDGSLNGTIQTSRVGLVSFESFAQLRSPLTHNAGAVKAQINGLTAGGGTDIGAGVNLSQAQLSSSPNKRVMIVMTDGQSATGVPQANAAKAAGTEIYTIGLGSGVNQAQLQAMASSPAHYFLAPNGAQLQQIFQTIATGVAGPAATNMSFHAAAHPDFQIIGASASKGSVSFGPSSVNWHLNELRTESVTINYQMQHVGNNNGSHQLHAGAVLHFLDDDGNPASRTFMLPTTVISGCNLPPVANAGPDQVVPMTGPAGALVTLDGNASTDDGHLQPLTFTWTEGATLLGSGSHILYTFPLGTHTVTLTVDDGQYQSTDTVIITVTDPFPPATTLSTSGTMGSNGWWVSPVVVTATAADNPGGSGVDYTKISADGTSTFTTYSGPVTVMTEGITVVQAYSVDLAGNQENPGASVTLKIDTEAPSSSATVSPTAPTGSNGWYNTPVTVSLAATDATSGVDTLSYRINGGAWQAYSGPLGMSADGTYTVEFYATDMAGNQEAMQAVSFMLDQTAPTISITSPTAGAYSDADMPTVVYSAADNLSGLAADSAVLDGNPVADGQVLDLSTLSLGSHTLTVTAEDMAGNSATLSVTFEIKVTYDSLEALKHRYEAMGWIDNHGIVVSLDQKLAAARRAHERGQHGTENNILEAFIAEVEAQRGNHITNDTAADTMIRDAQWLMANH